MSAKCKVNQWVTEGISIAIQVTFVFTFLTVFFFLYVQEVEKKEFQNQLNLIVDNLTKNIDQNLPKLINNQDTLNKENALVLINGIIDVTQEKIAIEAKSTVSDVLKQNHSVKLRALKTLSTVVLFAVGLAIVIILIGFCLPIKNQIKEAMLIVIFVGLTEFIFLQLIAKNYESADPNSVKRSLATAVQNWIRENKR